MVEGSTDSLEAPAGNALHIKSISKSSASPSDRCNTLALQRIESIGSCQAGGSSTRSFTDKSDSAKSRQNVVPHYLRASTGSCHDFCKYGRKDSSEEKRRVPIWKRNVKPLPTKLNFVQVMVSGEPEKEKVENKKPQIDTRNPLSYLKPSPDTKSYSVKLKSSLDKANVVKNKSSADRKNHSRELPSCDSKSYQQKCRISSDMKFSSTHLSVTCLSKDKPSSAKKSSSPDSPEVIKSIVFPNEKVPVKDGSSTAGKTKTSEKWATSLSKQKSSLKLNLVKFNPSLSSENSDVRHGKKGRTGKAGTVWNITASTKIVLSPRLKVASTRSRKDESLKLLSPLKGQHRVHRIKTNNASGDEKVSEKTLHIIKTESEKNVTESIPEEHVITSSKSLCPPELSSCEESSSVSSDEEDNAGVEQSDDEADEFISDADESPENGSTAPVVENHDRTLKKRGVVVSGSKHCSPVKLKFKAGKVVDLKSDYHTSRRLVFRRASITGTGDRKDPSERALQEGGGCGNAPGDGTSSEKVVLKHQDMQDKKDGQGLFNNVIEETASKLVESQKSKVKALVGAFETVISLQESKPSSSAVN